MQGACSASQSVRRQRLVHTMKRQTASSSSGMCGSTFCTRQRSQPPVWTVPWLSPSLLQLEWLVTHSFSVRAMSVVACRTCLLPVCFTQATEHVHFRLDRSGVGFPRSRRL